MTQAQYADEAHRYRLDERLASGGMGEVWRATDTTLGRAVAVKLLKAEYVDDATFRSRFETEARHAAGLHHPGIAQVFDYGETTERAYLVMELVDGQPLSHVLRPGSPMAPEAARDLIAQAAAALGVAHAAGIVHRDVKPGNLMLTRDRRIKVTDFGIARAADGVALTGTGQVMGTPQYLSPEQARGDTATAASDVYALGVVAFECLAGRRPFEADSPVATALAHLRDPVPDLPASVPAGLARIVRRCLAKKPAERYADASALAAALADPDGRPASPPPVVPVPAEPPATSTQVLPATAPVTPGPTPTGSTPTDRRAERSGNGAWLLVGALVGALVIVGLIWASQRDSGDGEQPDPDPTPSRSQSQSPTEEPSETESEPAGIEIDAGDYVGRDADDVAQDLEGLGLRVVRDQVDNPGEEQEGTVESVDPTGSLEEGDRITLGVWGPAPEETPTETPSESPTQSPSETPTSETPAPTDTTTGP